MVLKKHLPSGGHPSLRHPSWPSSFFSLGDLCLGVIRRGQPSSVSGTSVSTHPVLHTHTHPSLRLGESDKTNGTEGCPWDEKPLKRRTLPSRLFPPGPSVCTTCLRNVRLGLLSQGYPSRGHLSGAHPSLAPPSW